MIMMVWPGFYGHDVALADYRADYDEERLHFILNEVKTAFPVTEEWKSRR